MDEDDRAAITRWLGELVEGPGLGGLEDLESRLARLGVPELVALEVLLARRSEFILAATKVRADDVSVDHTANIQAVGVLIKALVASINASATIVLNPVGAELVASADAESEPPARSIAVTVDGRRRG